MQACSIGLLIPKINVGQLSIHLMCSLVVQEQGSPTSHGNGVLETLSGRCRPSCIPGFWLRVEAVLQRRHNIYRARFACICQILSTMFRFVVLICVHIQDNYFWVVHSLQQRLGAISSCHWILNLCIGVCRAQPWEGGFRGFWDQVQSSNITWGRLLLFRKSTYPDLYLLSFAHCHIFERSTAIVTPCICNWRTSSRCRYGRLQPC